MICGYYGLANCWHSSLLAILYLAHVVFFRFSNLQKLSILLGALFYFLLYYCFATLSLSASNPLDSDNCILSFERSQRVTLQSSSCNKNQMKGLFDFSDVLIQKGKHYAGTVTVAPTISEPYGRIEVRHYITSITTTSPHIEMIVPDIMAAQE